jgi:GNAT superfamily N-acetyltransferase
MPAPVLTVRAAVPADRKRLQALLSELRLPIAGLRSDGVYSAIAAAAGRDPRLAVIVADDGTRLQGVTLAVIDHKRYWRRFMLQHPRLLEQRVVAKFRRVTGASQVAGAEADVAPLRHLLSAPSGRAWGEAGHDIAVSLFTAVRPDCASCGLGGQLLETMFAELAGRGVRRFDGRIGRDNLPSVRMCHRIGWRIEEQGPSLFCTIDLPAAAAPQPVSATASA